MASDMVERVERSIASILSGNNMPDMSGDNRNRLSPLQRLVCTRIAKAAIEAMREPTEAMLGNTVDERGVPRILDFTTPEERDQGFLMARYSWRAMIDAALQENSHVG